MIVVSLSGGMDSTALASVLAAEGHDLLAVGFDYGQRHRRELGAAADVAMALNIPFRVLDLRGLLSGSALLGEGPVPHGHYAAETMRQTVVAGRNLLFIAALVPFAGEGGKVAVAVHSGDHYIYPDCRPGFIGPLARALAEAYSVTLHTPFIGYTKAEIAAVGAAHRAPFGLSWSCYEGGRVHCGRCGTCVERAEAFHLAGVADPTTYADPDYWQEAVRVHDQ